MLVEVLVARNGHGTVSLQEFVESISMLSNHMSQVEQLFAMIYQQLIESGCSADAAGNIASAPLSRVFSNQEFEMELSSCGLDFPKLKQLLSKHCGDQAVIKRSMLAWLVAESWVGVTPALSSSLSHTSRDSAYGDLGQVFQPLFSY